MPAFIEEGYPVTRLRVLVSLSAGILSTLCLSLGRAVGVLPKPAVEPNHLLQYLARREVARKAHLPGGAKGAPHGAPNLRRDANGRPVEVKHQYGFHRMPASHFQ